MKTYELTYIISPEIIFEEAESISKNIESLIQSKDGIILKQENPTAKPLAYTIKKQASGFIGNIEFNLEPEKINELQKELQKDGKIIRYMIIIKEAVKIKKEKKSQKEPLTTEETKKEITTEETKTKSTHKTYSKSGEEKIELKDIEQKIDEILGE